jgi:hypothetical protein
MVRENDSPVWEKSKTPVGEFFFFKKAKMEVL